MFKITHEHSKFFSSQPVNIHVIVRYYTQNSQVCTHDTTNISFMEFLRMVKTENYLNANINIIHSALGCLTGEHLACRPYLCMAENKKFQDSKFNISNITQAMHKMLQILYLLCCEIMCEILRRLILYF